MVNLYHKNYVRRVYASIGWFYNVDIFVRFCQPEELQCFFFFGPILLSITIYSSTWPKHQEVFSTSFYEVKIFSKCSNILTIWLSQGMFSTPRSTSISFLKLLTTKLVYDSKDFGEQVHRIKKKFTVLEGGGSPLRELPHTVSYPSTWLIFDQPKRSLIIKLNFQKMALIVFYYRFYNLCRVYNASLFNFWRVNYTQICGKNNRNHSQCPSPYRQ